MKIGCGALCVEYVIRRPFKSVHELLAADQRRVEQLHAKLGKVLEHGNHSRVGRRPGVGRAGHGKVSQLVGKAQALHEHGCLRREGEETTVPYRLSNLARVFGLDQIRPLPGIVDDVADVCVEGNARTLAETHGSAPEERRLNRLPINALFRSGTDFVGPKWAQK